MKGKKYFVRVTQLGYTVYTSIEENQFEIECFFLRGKSFKNKTSSALYLYAQDTIYHATFRPSTSSGLHYTRNITIRMGTELGQVRAGSTGKVLFNLNLIYSAILW